MTDSCRRHILCLAKMEEIFRRAYKLRRLHCPSTLTLSPQAGRGGGSAVLISPSKAERQRGCPPLPVLRREGKGEGQHNLQLLHTPPAIDLQRHAGQELCFVRTQEQRRISDVL